MRSPFTVEETNDLEALLAAKRLEAEGVTAADAGDLETALALFNQAVTTAPLHAAGYNNRAQVFRLKGDEESESLELIWSLTVYP